MIFAHRLSNKQSCLRRLCMVGSSAKQVTLCRMQLRIALHSVITMQCYGGLAYTYSIQHSDGQSILPE